MAWCSVTYKTLILRVVLCIFNILCLIVTEELTLPYIRKLLSSIFVRN